MEGLRVVGNPKELAEHYYSDGADELLFIDTVASLYRRENILKVIEEAADRIFIPLTVAGGVRSLENAKQLLLSGADKIALNTAAISRPELLPEIASVFGTQCVVLSVEAKLFGSNWELLTNNGRERTGKLLAPWLEGAERNGVGEVIVTSVDNDGTRKGLDENLMKFARMNTDLPLIGSGGIGVNEDLIRGFEEYQLDGIAIGTSLHYGDLNLLDIRKMLNSCQIDVRK